MSTLSLLSKHDRSSDTLKNNHPFKLMQILAKTFRKEKQKGRQKDLQSVVCKQKLPQIKQGGLRQSRYSKHSSSHKRQISQLYKQQLLHRDKDKNPLKYKIIGEFIGVNDQRVYQLKKDQILHIQSEYLKEKGRQNFKQGMKMGNKSFSNKSPNFNSQIHKIFGREQLSKHSKSNKSLHQVTSPQRKLRKEQQCYGKLVFKQVEKYLKQQKKKPNFSNRVKTLSAIDGALIDHIKLKIRRAETQLK